MNRGQQLRAMRRASARKTHAKETRMAKNELRLIDFSRALTVPEGGVLKNPTADGTIKLGEVCIQALRRSDRRSDAPEIGIDEIYMRGALARRLVAGGKIGLKGEERELIKRLLPGADQTNVMCSVIGDILDGVTSETPEPSEPQPAGTRKHNRFYIDFDQDVDVPSDDLTQTVKTLKLAAICVSALNFLAVGRNVARIDFQKANTRGQLARRISRGKVIGLGRDEIDLIKSVLPNLHDHVLSAIVVDILDGNTDEPEAAAAGKRTRRGKSTAPAAA